ncbi:tryptophan--tRNA ligase, mitochondrial isoform X3 [Harpegnathos saltator]|nr:tryptophan--tRNA ligase, mitochondrial isoform X3 [Harpegnathos saltator]
MTTVSRRQFIDNTNPISKDTILWNSAYGRCTRRQLFWCYTKMDYAAEFQRYGSMQHSRSSLNHFAATCGIDVKRSIIFQQSKVSMHAELCWVLACITTMARLAHLPQFKEKSESLKNVPLGLYIYPILQAADILLYKATDVPVGQDQAQHIQLAQDLARIFNKKFGMTFPIPRVLVSDGPSQRIKSLRDPTKKMSKSHQDTRNRLDILDNPDVLLEKVKKALTDFTSEVTYEPETRPGIANLINIHSLFTGKTPDEICEEAIELNTGQYKLVVADVVIEKLTPIRQQILRLLKEPAYLDEILKEGSDRATNLATHCWTEVTDKVFGSNSIQNAKSIITADITI